MKPSTGKAPAESFVTMTEIVLPSHANALGTIFGGVVMSWIDIAAAIAAGRHSRETVVTASVDALHFIAPIEVGHVVELRARVNFASTTSMEVGIRVDSEDPKTGEKRHNVTAYATFVALHATNGKPIPVIPVIPATEEDRRRFDAAKRRREMRIQLAKEFKKKS